MQNLGMTRQPCVYVVTNKPRGVLYVGVTAYLARRAWAHRNGVLKGFSNRYQLKRLVFIEFHRSMLDALQREKQLKRWRRAWKIRLIEHHNQDWKDLYQDLMTME